jgi:hypothetical protein
LNKISKRLSYGVQRPRIYAGMELKFRLPEPLPNIYLKVHYLFYRSTENFQPKLQMKYILLLTFSTPARLA